MKKVRIITRFLRLAQTKVLQNVMMILQCMTGNVNFPTPAPDLKTLGDAIDAYSEALANPASKANTALKKQLRIKLAAVVNLLALYVQMNCNNDETIALSSGFPLAKTKQPVGVLTKANNFKATPLHNCMIKLSNKKIFGADSYCYQYAPAASKEETGWISVNSTRASTVIKDLVSGTQYAFRVAGIGANPTVIYSDVITSYVL